jgi:hypothetical protein
MKENDSTLGARFAKAEQALLDFEGRLYDRVNWLTGGMLSVFNRWSPPCDRLYRVDTTSPDGHTQSHYTVGGTFPGWEEPRMLLDGSIQQMVLR